MPNIYVRFYTAPYDSEYPDNNLVVNEDSDGDFLVDMTPFVSEANYGAAYWDGIVSPAVWKVASAVSGNYADVQAIILAAARDAQSQVPGFNLGTSWNSGSTLGFYVGDPTLYWYYPAYTSTYELVSNARKNGHALYQGWHTTADDTVYTAASGEPQLGFNAGLQPPAVIAWDSYIDTIRDRNDAHFYFLNGPDADPNYPSVAAFGLRYIEGTWDGAPNTSPTDTGGIRFPQEVLTLIVAPGA
jgi:hypothetical protein